MTQVNLPEDRYFDPNPRQRETAMELYRQVADLPIVSPHGHVDPRLFADPDYQFGTPTEMFIIPDHYVFRMLYSQGIPLEDLGIPRVDGGPVDKMLRSYGWAERPLPEEELHDLIFDPHEAANVVNDPAYTDVADEMRGRLQTWLEETGDPILRDATPKPPLQR